MLLPTQKPLYTQMWSIDESSIQMVSVESQKSSYVLLLDPFMLGDGQEYVIDSK